MTRRAIVAGMAVSLVGALALPQVVEKAFASSDATGGPPAGDVYYEADCTTALSTGVVAPYLIGLNINAANDGIPATGATFGATGTVDLPIIGPVVAGIAAVGFIGTNFGAKADFTIGSTDGTATGTFAYSHTFPTVPVGTIGSPGREVTKITYAMGSTTLTSATAQFDPSDVGMSVAYTNIANSNDQRIDPTAVITAVAGDNKSVTISVPTLAASAATGDNIGLGRNISFTDGALNTGNVFTTAGTVGGNANIGIVSVKDIIENAGISLTFGGAPGVGTANCLETGWGEPGDVIGPLQTTGKDSHGNPNPPLTKPQLPAPPATGSATALVLATGGFISQPNTTQKITPPPAAHVTLVAGGTTTTSSSTTASTTTTTVSNLPSLFISDSSAVRPSGGTAKMTFVVTMSKPAAGTVKAHWATADNTAHQPADYKAKSGTVSIGAGKTTGTFYISITGGVIGQPAKTLFINLSAPVGATISRTQAIGTIVDNHLPGITVQDATAPVPPTRNATMIFNVVLSRPAATKQTCLIPYVTSDVTAVAGLDYKAKHGTIRIGAGKATGVIKITILPTATPGDIFIVQVGVPTNCITQDGVGIGTIDG